MEPYWADDRVALYVGDARQILPAIGIELREVCAERAARRLTQGDLFGSTHTTVGES